MKTFASLSIAALTVLWASAAEAAVTVAFVSPAAGSSHQTSLATTVNVTSTFAVSSLVAVVNGASYTGSAGTGSRAITIPLAGVPDGPFTVDVTATDAFGDTGTAQRAFNKTSPPVTPPPPTVTIVASRGLNLTSATLTVSCDPAVPCTKLTFASSTLPGGPLPVVNGNAYTGTIALPSDGATITVTGETAAGATASESVSFTAERSPRLETVATLPGPIEGASATEIRWKTWDGATFYVRDRATNVDTAYTPVPGTPTPNGYIDGDTEWRNGVAYPIPTPRTLTRYGAGTLVWVTGTLAAGDVTLWTRNVVTGAETSTPFIDVAYVGMADNGDALLGASDRYYSSSTVPLYHAFRVSVAGVMTRLTNGLTSRYPNAYQPRGGSADMALFSVGDVNGYRSTNVFTNMLGFGSAELHARAEGGSGIVPVRDGSRVAYSKPGSSAVWLYAGSAPTIATPWTSGTTIPELLDATNMLFQIHDNARYDGVIGVAPKLLTTKSHGSVLKIGTQWYLRIENVLFRVRDALPDGGAPDSGPAGDGGTDGSTPETDGGIPGTDGGTPGTDGGTSGTDGGGTPGGSTDGGTDPGADPGDGDSACNMHGSPIGSLIPLALVLGAGALRRRFRASH